ncbi:hypothetical protein DNU06_01340 [Putridiphycobacter roseus]|uniref:Toxin-antitoxin system YwqK family antitoxin n=1 Tax=Putridiphycobacter roseus TaxID=2219161 RepID=A0A2W1NG84_9FLAO|nr:hypothetical protein [Putridiphycobacter roseus]PZE18505.1 hypothetical protein DNU06_01340 [Putridiphycobacter roseus]
MNRIILLPFLIWMMSCQTASKSDKVETFGEAKSKGELATCDCKDLLEDGEGLLQYNGTPFTGICIIKYQGTESKYIEKQILNGLINGKISYYGRDGKVIFEEKFNKGGLQLDLTNESIRCNCKVLTKKKDQSEIKKYFKGQLFTGTCFDVFPNSEQPYFESAYQNGLRNGFTSYYNKNGDLLFTEKYRNDSLIKVIEP